MNDYIAEILIVIVGAIVVYQSRAASAARDIAEGAKSLVEEYRQRIDALEENQRAMRHKVDKYEEVTRHLWLGIFSLTGQLEGLRVKPQWRPPEELMQVYDFLKLDEEGMV